MPLSVGQVLQAIGGIVLLVVGAAELGSHGDVAVVMLCAGLVVVGHVAHSA